MMVTWNRGFEERYALLPDDQIASPAMGRLPHHAKVVLLESLLFRNPSRTAS